MMRFIRGNVERIAETEAQAERLRADGFQELPAVSQMGGFKVGGCRLQIGSIAADQVTGGQFAGTMTAEQAAGHTVRQPVDLADMTAKELRELAKERGLEGSSSLTKEELIKVLERSGVNDES